MDLAGKPICRSWAESGRCSTDLWRSNFIRRSGGGRFIESEWSANRTPNCKDKETSRTATICTLRENWNYAAFGTRRCSIVASTNLATRLQQCRFISPITDLEAFGAMVLVFRFLEILFIKFIKWSYIQTSCLFCTLYN
jgi:hypothetical protein